MIPLLAVQPLFPLASTPPPRVLRLDSPLCGLGPGAEQAIGSVGVCTPGLWPTPTDLKSAWPSWLRTELFFPECFVQLTIDLAEGSEKCVVGAVHLGLCQFSRVVWGRL